ncbi:MAG: 2-hydroxyacyl-CoA dehydratase family protein [Candidatus Lokiarchaeota archaeon]
MQVLEIFEDFSHYLKEMKNQGKKVIAFISHDNIPEELIDAAGYVPLRLIFAGNDELMDASHDYLPPSTCAFAQTCIGLFALKPRQFDFLEFVDFFIVSNHCVSDICASEVICKYFNIPRINFYIPYMRNSNSEKYFRLELLEFRKKLEEIRNRTISDEAIYKSIKKYNDFRKILNALNNLDIQGSIKLKLMQKAFLFGPEILPQLKEYIDSNSDASVKRSGSTDLIITGGSIFMNDTLIDLIEEGGGNIIFYDTWIGYNYYIQQFDENEFENMKDPINLLTTRYRNNDYSDHSVPNFLENRIAHIEQIYNDYKEKTGKKLGIINHIIKFCDHISLMSSFLKNSLQEKGIQVLNLERDYSRANRGQLSTRIDAYLEMISE